MNIDNLFFLFITICAMIFLLTNMAENDLISNKMRRRFSIVCVMIIIGEILDFLSWKISHTSHLMSVRIVHQILKAIDLCLIPLVICYLAHVIYENKKLINYIAVLICIVNTALIIINFRYPIIFYISDNNKYLRAQYWAIFICIYILEFILLLYQLHCLTKRNQNESIVSLLIIIITSSLGIIYIISNPFIMIDWIVIALSFGMIYIYYDNAVLSIDNLTLLLNARNYRNRIKTINFNTAIIFVDCNKFKFINDNYGHHAGDIALREYADALLTVYRKYGWVYRRSGDEFVVILKPNVTAMLVEANEGKDFHIEMKKLFKQLDENIGERAKKIHYLKLGVSCGYGIYISYTNSNLEFYSSSREFFSIDSAVANAEKHTYFNKKRKEKEIDLIEKELLEEIKRRD